MALLILYRNILYALSLYTLFCLLLANTAATLLDWHHQDWLNHGGDLHNRRYADKETKISPESVSKLSLKWKFYAGNDITVTPAIFDGNLYFPSWNGYIYALKASDGSLIWKKNLQKLTGLNATGVVLNVNWTVSRSTPTVAGDLLIIGIYGPAVVIAVERSTGELVWSTRLDEHAASLITMSGTYYQGAVYIGTSSLEEGLSVDQRCTFTGSLSKLNATSGAVLWQTFMLPDNHGESGQYAGAAIWGSSPSIDCSRNHVYIATGNLYSVPLRVQQCQEKQNNQTLPSHPDTCVEPDNLSDSIIALDLDSGKIKWYRQLGGYDVWFYACRNLSTLIRDIVVTVQKSGFAWALDRDDGGLVWSTEAGPGGLLGGGTWGGATDEERVYTNIANSERKNFTLAPSEKTVNSGGWVAMDARSGRILWSVADPGNATANGPVSVANGVVFAGSTEGKGPVYAIKAITGEILWSYKTGATVYGGVSVSNGCIYIGSGYKVNLGVIFPSLTAGNSLFAFCV
ncbi:hypothetical protein FNV43_RR14459 [Rhamnella rubrinervis]|uniref:Pyrrolo-quinoline quinone repeat domain-containing protein n=1 Tax=Rhamnella rubrinervis TaxID=2594499 RepID=A0A8K0H2V5_9ROSA|nr:hypothetical protein FNV43_RR14459 [Rhamnella rubrinervis]